MHKMTTRQEIGRALRKMPGYTLMDKKMAAAQRREVLSVLRGKL